MIRKEREIGCGPERASSVPPGDRKGMGYTLLETLVALSILGLSLVLILELFSGGLRGNKVAGDYDRAILHAKETMETILLSMDFEEGRIQGEYGDGYEWEAFIAPFHEENAEQGGQGTSSLFEIRVLVRWRAESAERQFELCTLKAIGKDDGDSDKETQGGPA